MALVDSHCHLSHERYAGELDAVLGRAEAAGVTTVVAVASELDDAARLTGARTAGALNMSAPTAGALTGTRAGVRVVATAGIHPHEVGRLPAFDDPAAEAVLGRLRELLARPDAVAVGECGLDFHYDLAPAAAQFGWFQRQLELAGALDLPVVVHCRSAEAEMIPRVREAGEAGVRGVLHCFPGDLGLLEVAMDAGWSVSFTGNVTFRNFSGLDAVREVPAGRYFLETDGPYLAPVPHRGKRNEPAYVPQVRDRVAEVRGVPAAQVEAETTAAALAFFR
jgi:TatD DNase family protein